MIDWTKVIITADDDTVSMAAGQVIFFASGVAGTAASVMVDSTETLAPNEEASVENLGDELNARLKFGIPQGIQGDPGSNASIDVVETVTLAPGSDAYVENVGTDLDARLKFGVPRGASGVWGDIIGDMDDQTDLKNAFDAVQGQFSKEILYFYQQGISAATNAEIFRITNAAITEDTVVLECTFANPTYITTDVTWTSYEGYIAFTGTATAATTANVTLGTKGN